LAHVDLVPASLYENELREGLEFVRDETDAPFAALALMKSPSVIVTYNKKHFNSRRLTQRHVDVRNPVEVVRELD